MNIELGYHHLYSETNEDIRNWRYKKTIVSQKKWILDHPFLAYGKIAAILDKKFVERTFLNRYR